MRDLKAILLTHFGIYVWILSGAYSEEVLHRRSVNLAKANSNITCRNCQGLVLSKENQTVYQGGKVVLKCTASGAKPTNYTWMRDGKALTSTKLVPIKRTKGGSRLRIKAAELDDGGTYLCLGHWSDGRIAFSNKAYIAVRAVEGPTKNTDHVTSTLAQADSPAAVPKFSNRTTATTNFLTPTRQPGYCVPYTGELCSKILKRGQEIYVEHHSPQQYIEKKLVQAFEVITASGELSEKCRPYVLPLLCHYSYSYCDKATPWQTPRPLCRDECDHLRQDICSSEYHIAQREELIGKDVLLPDCSKLPSTGSSAWKRCISLNIKPYPSPSSQPQKVDKCFNGTGEKYRGNKSETEQGYTCQAWNSTKPHFHLFSPSKYRELQGGHNFCRNPGGNKKRPWCYTTNEKILYDYCDIVRCDELPQIKIVSILWTVIPCLVFGIIVASAVILICWRCHKQMLYQANHSATPLVPVVVKTPNPSMTKELRREMITLRKDLGEGEFGKVYHGELTTKSDGHSLTCTVVVKTTRSTLSSDSHKREEFIRQAELWSKFDHANVIRIVGICSQGNPVSVVYEFLECGTLHGYLLRHSPLEDPDDCCEPDCLSYSDLLLIAVQVAAGMSYLANNQYIHGDIATRNCMVGPRRTVKITDIPLARQPYAPEYYREHNKPPMPIRWMAPEGVLLSKFTLETDIWSFGVLLWELFSYGAQPHFGYTDEEVFVRIREHVILPCPCDCPPRVYALMKDCWDILPPSRPRFSTIYTRLCGLRCDYDNRIIT